MYPSKNGNRVNENHRKRHMYVPILQILKQTSQAVTQVLKVDILEEQQHMNLVHPLAPLQIAPVIVI